MIQQPTRATGRADLGAAFHEYQINGTQFIATSILPTKDVAKEASSLGCITRENLTNDDAKHSNGAGFNRVNLISEDKSYTCEDYGLEGQLTDRDRANYALDFDAEVETVGNVKNKLTIAREVRVASAIFNTTTWTGSALYTDVSAAPWATAASAIIAPVLAACEKVRAGTGVKPDSLAISAATLVQLLGNTGIKAQFPGANLVTLAMLEASLASIFGLQNLFVGGGVYNTAKEGQAFSGSDIWSTTYAMIFKQQDGGMANPGLGRILEWAGNDQNLSNGLDVVTEYREEQTESDIYRVRDYSDEFIADAAFGHLLEIN